MRENIQDTKAAGNKQDTVPILRAIETYVSGEPAYFRIPAHRFERGVSPVLADMLGSRVFRADLTEAEGLDDLHAASGAIAEAEKLAAQLWGSEECRFLVNGSTCGNEAMLLACLKPGDKVLLARNVHKSVLMGLILSGAIPVWMPPEVICEGNLDGPVTAETVRKCLSAEPDCRAVLVVSPTYYGVCSPLREIAAVCHAHGIPLLVDEAHGSHLYFLDEAPEGAVAAGADLVTQSLHKTGGSMTQSSLLHIQGKLVDRDRLRESLALVMSTSPSYVLMASLDGARHQLAMQGKELMRRAGALAEECRQKLCRIPGIDVVESASHDPLRIVFSAGRQGISGTDLQEMLYRRSGISLEMSDPVYVVAVITWGNTGEDIDRLVCAVRKIAETESGGTGEQPAAVKPAEDTMRTIAPQVICSPREAWYAGKESVPLEKSAGRVSAESVIPYPPGIPVLYPGERITDGLLHYICRLRDAQTPLHGLSDRSLQTIRVLS